MGPTRHHRRSGLKMSSLHPDEESQDNVDDGQGGGPTIRVLLPPVQFVVAGQRDTFLEATL